MLGNVNVRYKGKTYDCHHPRKGKGKNNRLNCRRAGGTKHGNAKPCQKANGRLKKGWRYGKNGRCIAAKG